MFSVTNSTASSPGTSEAVMTLFNFRSEESKVDLMLLALAALDDKSDDDDDDDDDDAGGLRMPAVSRLDTVSMTAEDADSVI